jgi:hypothetical protein
LTREPLWLLGFLLVGLTTILACLGPLFVRRFVTLEKLRANNEVAGFKFATVGTLYALCRQRADDQRAICFRTNAEAFKNFSGLGHLSHFDKSIKRVY